MSFVSASDIFKLGKVAWRLWEYAFSKAKDAERQYAEFGADVQHLARNLEKLGKVIQNVTKQVPAYSSDDHQWDLKALPQICGDFDKTLKDCSRLLDDHTKFGRGRGGFIYNIQWNLSIEPDVTRLRDRVAFHNVKIATILKPLEIKLILDLKLDLQHDIRNVHSDLASRMTELHEMMINIQCHVTGNADSPNGATTASSDITPRAPEYLEARFEFAVRSANSELHDDKKFPLARGINAFHHHFEDSTCKFQPENTSLPGSFFAERTPEPAQYLNLMKSIWIVQKIKRGDDYAASSSDPLWEWYIRELDEKCLREYSRFTTKETPRKRLKEPDRRNLDLLREEEFRIWLDEEENDDDFQSGTDFLNEILHVLLSGTARNQKLELVLLRHDDTKLEMQSLSSKTTGPPNRQATITDINLRRAHLAPLYAYPKSTPEALNIIFKGNDATQRSSALSFSRLKDLLDFQQAITGYKVIYDEADINVITYISTGLFGGKQVRERGRIQMWSPRLLERLIPKDQQGGDSSKRRISVATGSSVAPSCTKSYSTVHTSPVQSEGSTSYSFQIPGLPMLVLYLEPDAIGKENISFLSILMDEKSVIKDHSCTCGRKRTNCIHSTIEKPKELIARRVQADREGDEVNLAMLGTYQKPIYPDMIKGMKWIQIIFKTHAERVRFEEMYVSAKQIYREKLFRYHDEMRQTKGDHEGLDRWE